MAQDRACELGQEALDEVEPGAVLGRESKREAAYRLSGKPGLGFSGDMRRVVVQDQLDRRTGRVSGIKKLEEFDKLAAAVAVFDNEVRVRLSRPRPADTDLAAFPSRAAGRASLRCPGIAAVRNSCLTGPLCRNSQSILVRGIRFRSGNDFIDCTINDSPSARFEIVVSEGSVCMNFFEREQGIGKLVAQGVVL